MEIVQRRASKISSSRVVSKANTMAPRRQAEPPGWAFGQKPRKGLALHRQPYIHPLTYQIFLHTTLHMPNLVCTCSVTSACNRFWSITTCHHHDYPDIYTYLCSPVTHGRPAIGLVANVPRHPRGGTERLPRSPPRPPTSVVHGRQLSRFSIMCYVHTDLVITVQVN